MGMHITLQLTAYEALSVCDIRMLCRSGCMHTWWIKLSVFAVYTKSITLILSLILCVYM